MSFDPTGTFGGLLALNALGVALLLASELRPFSRPRRATPTAAPSATASPFDALVEDADRIEAAGSCRRRRRPADGTTVDRTDRPRKPGSRAGTRLDVTDLGGPER